MRIELTAEKMEVEFAVGDHVFHADLCEAADLLYAAQTRTKAKQRVEGMRPYLEDVRVNVLGNHYGVPEPTYFAANEFAKIVSDLWAAEEKKITERVESLTNTASTPLLGRNGDSESGSPTANDSEPSTRSNEETSPTIGWG